MAKLPILSGKEVVKVFGSFGWSIVRKGDEGESSMIRIIEARVLEPYRVYLTFSDGAAGEIDLSGLTDRGVFTAWRDRGFFADVNVGSHGRSLEWGDELDLSADSLYLTLTGKTVQELFPTLSTEGVRA